MSACECGHTDHWHGIGGTGSCEHDGECPCPRFRLEPRHGYAQALVAFRNLCEGSVRVGFADEYVRGGVNLIADLFGVVDQDTGSRMDDVLADLRRIPMFADPGELSRYGVTYAHNPGGVAA